MVGWMGLLEKLVGWMDWCGDTLMIGRRITWLTGGHASTPVSHNRD